MTVYTRETYEVDVSETPGYSDPRVHAIVSAYTQMPYEETGSDYVDVETYAVKQRVVLNEPDETLDMSDYHRLTLCVIHNINAAQDIQVYWRSNANNYQFLPPGRILVIPHVYTAHYDLQFKLLPPGGPFTYPQLLDLTFVGIGKQW